MILVALQQKCKQLPNDVRVSRSIPTVYGTEAILELLGTLIGQKRLAGVNGNEV